MARTWRRAPLGHSVCRGGSRAPALGIGRVYGGRLLCYTQRMDAMPQSAHPAVRLREAGPHDLDAINSGLRNAVPVDPCAERVVQGQSVDQHQRAACAGPRHTPQRDTLGGGVRRARGGPSKQTEAGRVAERVVEREQIQAVEAQIEPRGRISEGGRAAGHAAAAVVVEGIAFFEQRRIVGQNRAAFAAQPSRVAAE